MKVLILNDNAFRTIPEAIKALGRLECLKMKRNRLNNYRGDLELNVPPRLKILDLEDNYSLTSLPKGLEDLEVIESLDFSYCGVESLPESIGKLSSLKEIHLAGCKLRKLPESIGRLLNLETLDLEGNGRLSSLPLSLHHLRKLRKKEAGTNQGLVLDNSPVDFPEPKIVKEGVVSVLTELLVEDSLSYVTDTIIQEVADDTIMESFSIDMATIVEEGLADELMLDMIDAYAAMDADELCLEDVIDDVTLSFLMEIRQDVVDEEQAALFLTDEDLTTFDMRVLGVAWRVMVEAVEKTSRSMIKEIATSAVLDAAEGIVMEDLLLEIPSRSMMKEIVLDAAEEVVMEDLLFEVTSATTKSIALEVEEEWRLGQTVPDEYDKRYSYKISTDSTTAQSVDLPAGCNLTIPPGASAEDSAIISVVLNPHGYAQTLMIGDNEQLVSDIIEMGPAGKTFSKPIKLKIPHSLPKFNKEREYAVMVSDDQGKSWSMMKTLTEEDQGERHVTVEVTHLSTYAVVARPLEHSHIVKEGEALTLTSSEQTGIEVSLPADSVSPGEEISFQVTPVDSEALNCAGINNAEHMSGIDSMSHIVKVIKGSNLLLKHPATVVLPLSPGKEDSPVRVLSCNERGDWEDVTDKVDDVVLKESKVAFKTKQLSSGYTVICCNDSSNATGIVNLVAKNVRARLLGAN
ncbi:uncharacterized protein LOC118407079 [Branchiostoma floridae]|uniref:Uncharacterized protein LOC118407079 n=1 Tax=Branchiostoma floridae TaxID=7739 RepID=A0A9J7HQ09_BRAFL|nr:uncharacterized protein LOC118407079 [Branchiostoma floridae]